MQKKQADERWSVRILAMHLLKKRGVPSAECNTPGVCHQLSNGFELKHDRLSGDDGERSNLQE